MRSQKKTPWSARIRNGLFFLFVQTAYLCLRKRSFAFRFRVLRGMARFVYYFPFYRKGGIRKRVLRNISLIRPDLGDHQGKAEEGGRLVVDTVARSWAFMLGNEFADIDEIAGQVKVGGEGLPLLLQHHREGKKAIGAVVHVGPVDEMAGVISRFGLQVYVPAEPVKPDWFFNLMMRLRLRCGDIMYEPVERARTLDHAMKQLSEDKRIVILFVDFVDARRRDGSGVFCRVGEAQARFPVGVVKLALETEATIFPLLPSWGRDWKSEIEFARPFELIKTGDESRDIEENTRRLIEIVFAPHIKRNYFAWLRLLWLDLAPIDAGKTHKVAQI